MKHMYMQRVGKKKVVSKTRNQFEKMQMLSKPTSYDLDALLEPQVKTRQAFDKNFIHQTNLEKFKLGSVSNEKQSLSSS